MLNSYPQSQKASISYIFSLFPTKLHKILSCAEKEIQESVSCSMFTTHFNYSLVEKARYTNMS